MSDDAQARAEAAGFVYWPGGDSPPEDYDGSTVLMNTGETRAGYRWDWRADPSDGYGNRLLRVIGYKRRPAPPDTVTPEAVARMTAHLRKVVAKYPQANAEYGDPGGFLREAHEIVALLPEPVDPVVLACREIVAASFDELRADIALLVKAGGGDDTAMMRAATAAYRAGQEAGK